MNARRLVKTMARVWVAVLVCAGASPAGAQIVGEGRTLAGQFNDAAIITLDVRDRMLDDVLDHIRNKVGVSIVTTPGTDGTVTIKLADIPWQDALELVAENAGCIVTQVSNRLYKVEKPERVTMSFNDVDIKQVIEAIAKAGDANIIVSERVTGTITMVVVDRPWRDAMDAVVKTNGYFLVEEDRGILRVVDEAGLSTHLDRRLFRLKYLRPQNIYKAVIATDFAETAATPAAGGGTGDSMVDFPLLPALRKMLSKEGDLDYFEDENALMVLDTKPVLNEIEMFIKRLDVEPVQIYVDVKFIITNDTDTSDYSFGVNNGIDVSLSGASRPSNLPFNLGKGGVNDTLFPGSVFDPISPINPGLLDFTATTLAVKLLKTDLNAEVVQAPRLITLNNKPGTIFVGEQVRFAQAEASTNQSGGLQLTIKEADNSPVDTGFQLFCKPHVIPGTNKIIMSVIPEAETLVGTTDPDLAGFDRFEVGVGSLGEAFISLPRVAAQTIVVEMMLESGETGIVGGLTQTDKRLEIKKVPFLGDIPLIGWLFKSSSNREIERGLLVFLTPYIVRGTDAVDAGLNQLLDKHEELSEREWEAMAAELAD